MVIRVLDHVPFAATGDQGHTINNLIRQALEVDGIAVLSFDGISSATSSFVNMAFVDLLSDFSLDDIRRHVRIVASTRQINEMIRSRLSFEHDRLLRHSEPALLRA